jgi:hypothetical protein
MYYIYHIPGVKIGCSKVLKRRIREQGFSEYEILEVHNDKKIASDREIQLQKQYGYKTDKIKYTESLKRIKKAQEISLLTKDEWLPKVDWKAREEKIDQKTKWDKVKKHPNYINRKINNGSEQLITTVYQYDLNGNFIKEINQSVRSLSEDIRFAKDAARCRETKGYQGYYNGFMYSKIKEDKLPPYKHPGKQVCQFDLDNNLIKIYKNQSQAAKEMGCCVSAISLVTRGVNPTAKGYKWKLLKDVENN